MLNKYILHRHGIINSVIRDGYGGLYRDDLYLQYKTYSDTQVIKIGRAKAWIRIKNDLIIGDLDLADQDFNATMDALKKIAIKLGVRQIFFHTSPHTHLHSLFAACYKRVPSFPVLFQDLGAGLPFDKIKFTFADIDIF